MYCAKFEFQILESKENDSKENACKLLQQFLKASQDAVREDA